MRSGSPVRLKKRRASLAADSIDSAPPLVKKTRALVQRRQRRETLGEVDGGPGGEIGVRGVARDLRDLCRDRLADLLAPVADVAVPQRGGGVDVAAALLVPEPRSLAAFEHELAAFLDEAHVGEGMPEPRHGLDANNGPTASPCNRLSRAWPRS